MVAGRVWSTRDFDPVTDVLRDGHGDSPEPIPADEAEVSE